MSQAVIAPIHRALTSNAGDAARYAEQLLHRICRRWGMRVDELKDFSGKEGRQRRVAGDTIMRSAVIADWLRELDASGCICTNGVNRRAGVITSLTLALLLNTTERSVCRYLAAVRRYQDRKQLSRARGTERGPCSAVEVPVTERIPDRGTGQSNSFGVVKAMTGYDRASMEEEVLGGGGASR